MATRDYSARGELIDVGFGGQPVVHRAYDRGERLVETDYANHLVETRTYVPGDNLVATIETPGLPTAQDPHPTPVTRFDYTYDEDKRKTLESDAAIPGADQHFTYDDEGRLIAWSRGTQDTQTWSLSPVGDWKATTQNGVTQTRTHDPVHETRTIDGVPLAYDPKGNLTQDLRPFLRYRWDDENRLIGAVGFGPQGFIVATYRYDALGRRVQKVVNGRATTWVNAGAQQIAEISGSIHHTPWVTGSGAISATASATTPLPQPGILQGPDVVRIDFRPDPENAPAGWLVDTGGTFASHGDGLPAYGWDKPRRGIDRDTNLPAPYDAFICMAPDSGDPATWSIALPNGTYKIAIVMGDPSSTDQTDTIKVNGQIIHDPSPAANDLGGYPNGNIDIYAANVQVTDGTLTLAPLPGEAYHPKLCSVELQGPLMTAPSSSANFWTAKSYTAEHSAFATRNQGQEREYIFGSYLDEVLSVQTKTRQIFFSANHLFSVQSITDKSGLLLQRCIYDPFGSRYSLRAAVESGPTERGFTGQIRDSETLLYYFRQREYNSQLGDFLSRDPSEYVNGHSLYAAYFVPNALDPRGKEKVTQTVVLNPNEQNLAEQASVEFTYDKEILDCPNGTVDARQFHGEPLHIGMSMKIYDFLINTLRIKVAGVEIGADTNYIVKTNDPHPDPNEVLACRDLKSRQHHQVYSVIIGLYVEGGIGAGVGATNKVTEHGEVSGGIKVGMDGLITLYEQKIQVELWGPCCADQCIIGEAAIDNAL